MRCLILHIALSLIPAMSFAQTDTLAVLDGTGMPGDQVEAQVALTNVGRVAGAQFDLVAERGRLRWGTPRLLARAAGMSLYSQTDGDTLRVVLLDPGRRTAIAAGTGPVLAVGAEVLAASGEALIRLVGARVSDDGHPPQVRDAAVRMGRVVIPSVRFILQGGDGVAQILLTNPERVSAAQFDLVYDAGTVSAPQVRPGPRSTGLSAYAAPVSAGRTRVVLADIGGSASLPPGEGGVAEAIFTLRRSGRADSVCVGLERAVVSGAGGVIGPVGVRGGWVRPLPWRVPRVVIDEILSAPPEGPTGDANGDGLRDAYQDEFVEILNADTAGVDLGGWMLSDDDVSASGRFRFPSRTVLQPGARAVLFGGGRPAGVPGQVFTDDGRIGDGLSNAGDSVLLMNAEGDTIAAVSFGASDGQSLVRDPDGGFVLHGGWPGRGAFSPGLARPLASGLRVSPDAVTLTQGQSAALWGLAEFTDGVRDTVRAGLTWRSEKPEIVAVTGTGKVTGLRR